jgi:hypothetical protein
MHEVIRVEDRARLRPEDQIVRNTVLASHHSGEQPRIAQFEENLPELARKINPAGFLAFRGGELALDEIALHQEVTVRIVFAASELNVAPLHRDELPLTQPCSERHQKKRVQIRA